jgi:hypothetical protein
MRRSRVGQLQLQRVAQKAGEEAGEEAGKVGLVVVGLVAVGPLVTLTEAPALHLHLHLQQQLLLPVLLKKPPHPPFKGGHGCLLRPTAHPRGSPSPLLNMTGSVW